MGENRGGLGTFPMDGLRAMLEAWVEKARVFGKGRSRVVRKGSCKEVMKTLHVFLASVLFLWGLSTFIRAPWHESTLHDGHVRPAERTARYYPHF